MLANLKAMFSFLLLGLVMALVHGSEVGANQLDVGNLDEQDNQALYQELEYYGQEEEEEENPKSFGRSFDYKADDLYSVKDRSDTGDVDSSEEKEDSSKIETIKNNRLHREELSKVKTPPSKDNRLDRSNSTASRIEWISFSSSSTKDNRIHQDTTTLEPLPDDDTSTSSWKPAFPPSPIKPNQTVSLPPYTAWEIIEPILLLPLLFALILFTHVQCQVVAEQQTQCAAESRQMWDNAQGLINRPLLMNSVLSVSSITGLESAELLSEESFRTPTKKSRSIQRRSLQFISPKQAQQVQKPTEPSN